MRRSMSATCAVTAAVACALAPAAGCGGDDEEQQPAKKRPAEAGKATTLKLESPGGANRYDKKRLTTAAGKVTIRFRNDSERPHNVIVIPGEKLDYKKRAVLQVHTISRLSGERTAKATGNLKPGPHVYYCSIQNHAALGMVGALSVR